MLLLLAACVRPVPPPPADPRHGEDVLAARDALVNADLPRFTAAIRAVSHQFPLPGAVEPQAPVRAALDKAVSASNLSSAAMALAELGAACGSCHSATGAQLAPLEPGASSGDGVRAEMARHDRALALMWSGLVRPSEEELKAGAEAFAASTLRPLGGDVPDADRLDELVNQTAGELATGPAADRPAKFAVLVGTCAACHLDPPAGVGGEVE